jgi:hypothetical protein
MTTYYVGVGGSDAAAGTSWALRRLTVDAAENIPVVAGDTVYIGPGSYEVNGVVLTCDVSGSSGSPITYIGDVTGRNTDGVGGVVRLASTANNLSGPASNTVAVGARTYRTFRGLTFGGTGTSNYCINYTNGATNLIVEDCAFTEAGYGVGGTTIATDPVLTVRRCVFINLNSAGFSQTASAHVTSTILIENCIFASSKYNAMRGIYWVYAAGLVIKNCTFDGCYWAVQQGANPTSGINTVTNSSFTGGRYGVHGTTGGATYFTENYNNFDPTVSTPRTIIGTGANSTANWVNYELPLLLDGHIIGAWNPWRPTQWSDHRRKAGTAEATDDLFGIDRPTTSAKKSWGAIQYQEPIRSTTQTYSSSTASLKLEDAGEVQFVVPVTATSTTIAVRVYREANYAGTNPRLVIKQAGQSDRTTTDAGSSAAFNALTDTFTPAALPGFVTVCLQSLNTATSGSYNVYFDALSVS